MTYNKALVLTKSKNGSELARFCGVTEQAVKRWRDNDRVPRLREFEILEKVGAAGNAETSTS